MAPGAPPLPGRVDVDPLLAPLLDNLDDAEWERRLTSLVTDHIQPVVSGVVHRRLGGTWRAETDRGDACFSDVGAEATTRVIGRLRTMAGGGPPIADLRAYVAVATFHACDDYLRRKYPQRARLKNRLRYVLTHDAGLALWANDTGDWLAGLAEWRGRPPTASASQLQRLMEDPRTFAESAWRAMDLRRTDAFALLPKLLKLFGQPVELDSLVTIVAELWDVRDVSPDPGNKSQTTVERQPDPAPGAATMLERRLYLERLWAEIRTLPLRQRLAVLLNLRDEDGGEILSLFPCIGVATLRDLAAALEMSPPAFAALWNELPLDDAAIGTRLGLTRQQIINLRKSARERLARRMRNAGF